MRAMDYREYPPSALLAPLVECYWHLLGSGSGEWEPVYPDTCGEIVLNLGEPADERRGSEIARQPRHLVYGQIEERMLLRSAKATEVLAIRLRPWGASALLRTPGYELARGAISLDSIAPVLARRLISIAESSRPVAARIRRIDACLARWAAQNDTALSDAGRVAGYLQRTPTRGASDVANLTGWSVRTAQRRFRAELGLSPKRFHQITRFLRFLRWLELEPETPIAGLACAAGYYDQPHLHRDLRRFTGETPASFRSRRAGTFDSLYGDARLDRLVAI